MNNVVRLKDGMTNINPHVLFTDKQLEEIFEIAKKHSAQIHAMVRLLYDMAARIQDVVGMMFK